MCQHIESSLAFGFQSVVGRTATHSRLYVEPRRAPRSSGKGGSAISGVALYCKLDTEIGVS